MNPDMGMVVMTQTVNALPEATKWFLIQSERNYQDFKQDGNDPYCEHDFGVVGLDGASTISKSIIKIQRTAKARKIRQNRN